MSDLYDVIDGGNAVRNTVHTLDAITTSPVNLEKHKDPLEFLVRIEKLKQFLPYEYYSDKHTIGTDPFSNAAIIKHIDFESKGRGGLDFKLERNYSSLLSYSYKGEFLINKYIKRFYEELKSIISSSSFKNSIENWFYEKFRPLLITARDLDNVGSGSSAGTGPQFDDTSLFPDLESLKNSPSVFAARFLDINPPDITVAIDTEHKLHRWFDLSWDEYATMLPPGVMGPLYGLVYQLRLLHDDFLNLIDTLTQSFDDTIAQLEDQDTLYIDSILGDGWAFNLPFIQLPSSTTNQGGFISFDAFIREEYNGASDQKFQKQQGFLIKLTSFPNERDILQRFLEIYDNSDSRTISQGDIDELEYRFKNSKQQSYYFNTDGQLRFITDVSHNNVIIVDYVGSMIHQIIDAAGNTYSFDYDSNDKLENIVSSYGKEIEYSIKKNENDLFILESVKEGDHNTSYEYQISQIFNTPLFVDGEVDIPIIKKEINILGGVINFFYYMPSFEEILAGFGRNSLQPDTSLRYSLAKTPHSIERIYRNSDYGDILVGHPRIEQGIIETLAWEPEYRKTVSVYKDHIVEYEFRETHGEMKLFRTIVKELEWNPAMDIFISQYSNYVGDALKSELFRYYHDNLLKIRITTTGNPSVGNPSYSLKQTYIYPPDPIIRGVYGLPEEIIFSQDSEELKRIKYFYYPNTPVISEIKGDTKRICYSYFIPIEQDPARCGKPTAIMERTQSSPYIKTKTSYWYDKYGNVIKTKNAMNRFTRYEYKSNNGLPETFLHKIIEEERDV